MHGSLTDRIRAMLLRLYNDDSPLVDNSKDRFNKTNGAQTVNDDASVIPGTTAVENVTATAAEVHDVPENTVALNTAMDLDVEGTMTAVGVTGIDTEEHAMQAEHALGQMAQNEADNTKEIVPGVTDEEDAFNTTV